MEKKTRRLLLKKEQKQLREKNDRMKGKGLGRGAPTQRVKVCSENRNRSQREGKSSERQLYGAHALTTQNSRKLKNKYLRKTDLRR